MTSIIITSLAVQQEDTSTMVLPIYIIALMQQPIYALLCSLCALRTMDQVSECEFANRTNRTTPRKLPYIYFQQNSQTEHHLVCIRPSEYFCPFSFIHTRAIVSRLSISTFWEKRDLPLVILLTLERSHPISSLTIRHSSNTL